MKNSNTAEIEAKLAEVVSAYESEMKELQNSFDKAETDEERSILDDKMNILEYCFRSEEAELNLKLIRCRIEEAPEEEKELLLLQEQIMSSDIKNNEELTLLYTQLNAASDDKMRQELENKINLLQHSFSAEQSRLNIKITDKKLEKASEEEKELLLLQKESLASQEELDTILAGQYYQLQKVQDEAEINNIKNTIEFLNNSYQNTQDKINIKIIEKELKTASGGEAARLELQKEMLNRRLEHKAELNELNSSLVAAKDENEKKIINGRIEECIQAYNAKMKKLEREMHRLEA